jgi:hypothetical protein
MADARTCTATKRDGSPCTIRVVGDSCFCFAHHPAYAEQRTQARAQGGRNRSNVARAKKLVPARLLPVLTTLEDTLQGVTYGTVDPRRATAAASVARAIAAVFSTSELEQRVRALEGQTDGA